MPCVICGKPSQHGQCAECAAQLAEEPRSRCPQCGTISTDGRCGVCGKLIGKWASDGRVGLGVTLWQMSTRDEWLDGDGDDDED